MAPQTATPHVASITAELDWLAAMFDERLKGFLSGDGDEIIGNCEPLPEVLVKAIDDKADRSVDHRASMSAPRHSTSIVHLHDGQELIGSFPPEVDRLRGARPNQANVYLV